ncbi:hypothetical protein [Pseudoalteromonas umbrosa]|uniref:hypothetical protein n=1 Tax=Pseudoalteromonas umbrosa TaxID=3048489 RepID=UPI0024C41028|nr:hypothetical protein [Pseudoalteromonas sp. B95]MDK1290247.1 hypothetical protein [Pseudoalteromonas sp. B95]
MGINLLIYLLLIDFYIQRIQSLLVRVYEAVSLQVLSGKWALMMTFYGIAYGIVQKKRKCERLACCQPFCVRKVTSFSLGLYYV